MAADTLDSHPATATSSLVSKKKKKALFKYQRRSFCLRHIQTYMHKQSFFAHTQLLLINIQVSHQIICRVIRMLRVRIAEAAFESGCIAK